MANPFRYFGSSPEVIRLTVMLYIQYPLLLRRVEDIKTLQTFASAHASLHSHFNLERHLVPRETFKKNRFIALAGWRHLAA